MVDNRTDYGQPAVIRLAQTLQKTVNYREAQKRTIRRTWTKIIVAECS